MLVFTNLLAHADKMGHVDIHPRAIAEEVGLTVEQVRAALDELEAPDAESRSPEEDGRRIIRLDAHRAWGWAVVNYIKYRAIKSEDDRREQNRASQQVWRDKHKQPSAIVSSHQPSSAESAHTEAEAEAKAEAKINAGIASPKQPPRATRAPVASRPAIGAETWARYENAYASKYGVSPVRNSKVNSQLAQLVARLGPTEAPDVAAYYVTHRHSLYVSAKHCVDLLLRDAEKLRTEWATGTQGTHTQAVMADKTQTNYNSFAPLIAAARKKEAEDAANANK